MILLFSESNSLLVKFLVSHKEVFYVFEVFNADCRRSLVVDDRTNFMEKHGSSSFVYKVRHFVLREPVKLDFFGDIVCMITKIYKKLTYFNIGR